MGGRGAKFLRRGDVQIVSGGGGGLTVVKSGKGKKTVGGGGGGTTDQNGSVGKIKKSELYKGKIEGRTYTHAEFNEQFKDWSDNLTAKEKAEWVNYRGTWYGTVNSVARGHGKNLSPETVKMAKATKTVMKRSIKVKLKEDTITYRGTNITDDALYGNMTTPGAVWRDKGVFSTSLSEGTAKGFIRGGKNPVVMVVRLPKGTKAGYMDSLSTEWEREVVPDIDSNYRTVGVLGTVKTGGRTVPRILVEFVGKGRGAGGTRKTKSGGTKTTKTKSTKTKSTAKPKPKLKAKAKAKA